MKSRGFDVGYESVKTNFSDQLWAGIKYVDMCSLKVCDIPIVITCGSEETAKHTAKNTKHYAFNNESGLCEAVDLRTRHYTEDQRLRIEKEIFANTEFIRNFDLIFEGDHWHLEYDPK